MNTKLKCLILDDELPGLTYLKMLCEQIPEIEIIKSFNSSILFLKEAQELEFDLCIIDIEMPEINGLQVAAALKGKPVIFTTGYNEYAAEAFDLDAIDYVRKPVTRERLQLSVEKAIKRMITENPAKGWIQLNTDKGKSIIFYDQLSIIRTSETDSRDKDAMLQNNSTLRLKNISFARLIELLPIEQFCRVNKKELIAFRCIRFFSHDSITTNLIQSDGKPLVVFLSDIYRKDFLRFIAL